MKRLQSPWLVLPLWACVSLALAWGRLSWWILAGAASWPLVEYAAHRFGMHGLERHRPKLYKRIHGVHHLYPRDLSHFTIPLAISVPLVAAIAGALHLAGAWSIGRPALAGLLAAYVAYDLAHLAAHGLIPFAWFASLARRHARHHARPARNFGVTTSAIDRVVGTWEGT